MKKTTDYANLVNLLAIYTECQQRLDEIQIDLDRDLAALAEDVREEFSCYQEKLGEAQSAIIAVCEQHPEWLAIPRSIKTPCGSVSVKTASRLHVSSIDSTLSLLSIADRYHEFVRQQPELDLEALEKLTTAELASFGITRIQTESYTIRPAKVDLGKAIKAANEKAASAAN